MDFILFLLVNATLFIRPAEIVPDLTGWPIYEVLIVSNTIVSGFAVARQLQTRALLMQPITVCVVGFLVAIMLSHLAHLAFGEAASAGFQFAKVVLYYLLLVAVVNTPARLRWFLSSLIGFILVLAVLALAQYHGFIDIPSLATLEQREIDRETGDVTILPRLQSTGIYNDPNDLSLILVVGIVLCLYRLGDRRAGLLRFGWLPATLLFGYALMLTRSRGGLLALAAALLVLFQVRYGWKKAVLAAGLALPCLFLLFAGRQTSIDLSDKEDTAQARIQLWSEGLQLLRQSPLFGIGSDHYADEVGLVAHNSFVHTYAELGLFGGTLFVGAFYLACSALRRLGAPGIRILSEDLRRLRPFMLALVVGYAAGLWSLSRCYIVSTHMVFGLVTVYWRLTPVAPALPALRFDDRLIRRLGLVSAGAVAAIYVFVRVFARFG